jgi:outer membrane protein assembly factor BamB
VEPSEPAPSTSPEVEIYLAKSDGFERLDPETGEALWQLAADEDGLGRLTFEGDALFRHVGDHVDRIDLATGEKMWSVGIEGSGAQIVALEDRFVFAAKDAARGITHIQIVRENGSVVCGREVNDARAEIMKTEAGQLILRESANLSLLDPNNATAVWSYEVMTAQSVTRPTTSGAKRASTSIIASDAKNLYVLVNDIAARQEKLIVLDAMTGELVVEVKDLGAVELVGQDEEHLYLVSTIDEIAQALAIMKAPMDAPAQAPAH